MKRRILAGNVIQRFEHFLRKEEKSKNTIEKYVRDVRAFAAEQNGAEITKELGNDGRILLRESGTEPVMRVMVEAGDTQTCRKYVDRVVGLIKAKGYCV